MAPGRAWNPQFLVAPRRAPSDGRFATAGASRMASRFHSLKLMRKHGSLENLVSAAAIRTVVKPYMQDALKEHSVLLEKNLEVLSLRRDINVELPVEWCLSRDKSNDLAALQWLEKEIEMLHCV
ncbi:uncharacterized protein LOC112344087 isoform X1 [Selaginella moellendorffii]|uniref:uncharacterized protein LOC112344087 isoform X1 n=1 Tax=Selaginella moellendorffii TaxID=88036 RepID=UPI000D1C9E96|nr:uncharacterized protein LOC112344087 isoform X1 [Selaginella moellendorffii]|eukprot:XP_024523968.1 uncharacterized protein LOC112344087 isoform X1 [Selaginella moellendorffii]